MKSANKEGSMELKVKTGDRVPEDSSVQDLPASWRRQSAAPGRVYVRRWGVSLV